MMICSTQIVKNIIILQWRVQEFRGDVGKKFRALKINENISFHSKDMGSMPEVPSENLLYFINFRKTGKASPPPPPLQTHLF